ncbi:MAG: HK97 gp10 family phage protein [Lachnospiraceae bacterium]|nr:HK97 gp10 family phage protein [Ruminococcus sp.]MCM1276337.1 HK97 gp10 family phage protein [Lachnospiraceae bacterium]
MAKCNVKLPEETLLKLSKLGKNIDRITAAMLEDGAAVVQAQAEKNLEAVIGKGTKYKSRSTGGLQKLVKSTKVYEIANGDRHIKIGVWGYYYPNGRETPAPLVANVLEHGRSNMTAKPWLKPALSKSRKACIAAMQKRFDDEVKKL